MRFVPRRLRNIDMTGFGIVIPVMPDLIVGLTHTSLGEAARMSGWLMGVFAAMQFLFGPVLGGLGDRYGRRPVILACLLAFSLDYFVMGLAPTYGWLFVTRAIAGITGATYVPATAHVADITPPERRAQNFGLIGAAWRAAGDPAGPHDRRGRLHRHLEAELRQPSLRSGRRRSRRQAGPRRRVRWELGRANASAQALHGGGRCRRVVRDRRNRHHWLGQP